MIVVEQDSARQHSPFFPEDLTGRVLRPETGTLNVRLLHHGDWTSG